MEQQPADPRSHGGLLVGLHEKGRLQQIALVVPEANGDHDTRGPLGGRYVREVLGDVQGAVGLDAVLADEHEQVAVVVVAAGDQYSGGVVEERACQLLDLAAEPGGLLELHRVADAPDRKSTRLNSSHLGISYAVFCFRALRAAHSFPTRRSSDLGTSRVPLASTRFSPTNTSRSRSS